MNRIFNFAYKSFDYAKNSISHTDLSENNSFEKIITNTVEISKGVFQGVMPHIIAISPMYLSTVKNLRILSLPLLFFPVFYKRNEEKNWLDTVVSVGMITTNIGVYADYMGWTPMTLEYRLAMDSLLVLTTAIGSGCAIYQGTNQMISSWNSVEENTSTRVSNFISGMISTTIGAMGFGSCFSKSLDTVVGLSKFDTIDSQQKIHIVRNKAISSLGKEKSCTGVIIDGFFEESSPAPISELLYETCETRSYVVKSKGQFCKALDNAKNYFHKTIDVMILDGHATREFQFLAKNYLFKADPQEIACMNQVLSPEAQVFSLGCHTAAPGNGPSLIDRLSEALPGMEITGVSELYNNFFTTTDYIKGRFQHNSYFPYGSSTVVTKKT